MTQCRLTDMSVLWCAVVAVRLLVVVSRSEVCVV